MPPLDLGELGPHAGDEVLRAAADPLVPGLQRDVHAAVVRRLPADTGADRRADTPATSGSLATISCSFSCTADIWVNEMSCAASVMPKTTPVSCGGKKPLGITMNR